MRFATGLPGVNLYPPVAQPWESAMGAEDFQLVARTADEAGFDCISIPEHIVVPDEMVELMGPTWSHAMTVMAFVAGATTRIEVDSAVIVLPYHQPVVLAKAKLLAGRDATVYFLPQAIQELKAGGARYVKEPLLVHDRIILAEGPPQSQQFAQAIRAALS